MAKAKKVSQQSKDALTLGGLFILSFVVLQIVNFLGATIEDPIINMVVLKNKCISQAAAFLTAYFITLIYIKNRAK